MALPKVLMVAEKPSIALSIATALSHGQMSTRRGSTDVHEFDGRFLGAHARFKVTSVIGHVFSVDFHGKYQDWATTDPLDLFQAQIIKTESNPKAHICKHLKQEARGCHYLVLWLDCDREGENICFEGQKSIHHLDGSMAEYLGRVQGLLHDFNELLPPAATTAKELEQRRSFFMLLALYGLPPEYSSVRDQILGSPTIPTLDTAWSTLLRVPAKPSSDGGVPPTPVDSSALVFQGGNRAPGGDRGHFQKTGKPRPKCDHCHKLGHTIDRCYALHGRPSPRTAHVAQTAPPPQAATPTDSATSPAIFNDFIKWYEERQAASSTASVAHTGPEFETDDWHRM
ncbi:unnamed protein product [Vicia faba]|uniref:DNA topoisomerase n=1 Tax=Vicia faba TaxID=3906 RepID=A0AAV0ZM94_VICFA|nr:unnamed protein product [Vicia faba]